MEYITREQAFETLQPLHRPLAQSVNEAWTIWKRDIAGAFPQVFRRTVATVMQNIIYARATLNLAGVEGVNVVDKRERVLIDVRRKLLVWVKKVDDDFHTRNVPTEESRRMRAQDPIEELEELASMPRVVLGYHLRSQPTLELDGIWIVYSKNDRVMWKYAIDGGAGETELLPFGTPPAPSASPFSWKPDQAPSLPLVATKPKG